MLTGIFTHVQLHRVHAAGYQERPLPGHKAESNVSEGNTCAVTGLLLLSTSTDLLTIFEL